MARGSKPKWKAQDIARVGRGALTLALEFRTELEPRLAAGLIDGLTTDLDAFEGKRTAAVLAPESLREATRTQDAAAKAAHEFVTAIRAAVTRVGASAAVRAAFGLKVKLLPTKVSSIVAGLDAVIDAAGRHPDVARQAGVLPADVDRARALRQALVAADASQEVMKQSRRMPTAERNALQRRIEQAVDSIVAAGLVAFVLEPATAARFRDLIPSKGKRKARPAEG